MINYKEDDENDENDDEEVNEFEDEIDPIIKNDSSKPAIEDIKLKEEKIGRNDQCPCGSGKKFKKCCMGKEKSE